MLAIFERRRGQLGSKISGYGSIGGIGSSIRHVQSTLEADTNRKDQHVRTGAADSDFAPNLAAVFATRLGD